MYAVTVGGIRKNPLVSVGIPTYNRPDGLRRTLECITKQTYKDLEIIVSDNCSPGSETTAVVRKYIEKDSRISYYRQEENKGPQFNFQFVLKMARGEYFMWAADDDEWDADFVKTCVKLLSLHSKIGMAFCNIVNIDSFGRIIREYPSFKIFSGFSSTDMIARYLKSPEFFGKANLIYSVFRIDICKKAWEACPLTDQWGSDMCFVLGALARGGLCIDNRVLFRKRIVRDTDNPNQVEMIVLRRFDSVTFDFIHSFSYIKNNLRAVKGTPYYWTTLSILIKRLPGSFRGFCLRPFHYVSIKSSGRKV